MKRYLVCIKSKATDDNPSFAGQEHETYYGKRCCLVASYGSHAEATHMVQPLNNWWIKEYGYTRKCDAARNWCYRNPDNGRYWTSTASIVEVEI